MLSLLCLQLSGQEYYANSRSIGRQDGLSHYRVLALLSDTDGMWIGTEDGLNFFDGYSWQYWTKDDGQLAENQVNFIFKDQAGFLWVFQTEEVERKSDILSISLISPDRNHTYKVEEKPGTPLPFSVEAVQQFFADKAQRLYFLVAGELWEYSLEHQFRVLPIPEHFEPHCIMPGGTLVGRSQEKLALLPPAGELNILDYPLDDNYFQLLGNEDRFWIWQPNHPCQVFQRKSDQYISWDFHFQQYRNSYFALLHFNPEKEELWINRQDTTYLLDRDGKVLFESLLVPRRIEMDRDGNYWLAKYEIEMLRLQKRLFRRLLHNDQIPEPLDKDHQCRGIYQKDHQLLVCTYGGVRTVDLATGKLGRFSTGNEVFFDLLKDRNGDLWMGYNDLVRLDQETENVSRRYPIGDLVRRTWCLYEAPNGDLWLGENKGLFCLSAGKLQAFSRYNEFPELREASTLFFFEDQDSVLWLGGNRGLFQLDLQQGVVAAYGNDRTAPFYLPGLKFQHMYQDEEGIFWLVTEDAGLIRWDKEQGEIKQFDKSWGMLTNNIYAVYEDAYQYLWMSSFNGLIRFDKTSEKVEFFHEEDGVAQNEFNRISHFQAEDGHLYFGSQNGVTAFHPRDFLREYGREEPFTLSIGKVSIIGEKVQTDFWANGKPIELDKLPPGNGIIDLEITGSNSFWAGSLALYYSLEKQGEEEAIISREQVSFSEHIELFEMASGNYQLTVRAVQPNGKQLGESLLIPIRIKYPIYQQPLFWLGALLILLAAFWGYTRWRTIRLEKQKASLELLVLERTQEILENQETIDQQAKLIESMQTQLHQQDEAWLAQFKSIILQRLEDPGFYLPDVIDDLQMGRTAFFEKVKLLTQMTPNQYIQEVRLNKARAILEEGYPKTVKEVALAVGMKEPKYFSKLFKERFGRLPSSYLRAGKT
ncbi:MAG: helix-turn-helix domain-containing protein [Bacteroidota bacterium]